MHSIDLYMVSMLHTTFWSVSKLRTMHFCQISLDTVRAPFGRTAAGQGLANSAHIAQVDYTCCL